MTTTGTTGTTDSSDSDVLGKGGLLGGGGQGTDDAGAGLGGADDRAEAREELAPRAGPLHVVRTAAEGPEDLPEPPRT